MYQKYMLTHRLELIIVIFDANYIYFLIYGII